MTGFTIDTAGAKLAGVMYPDEVWAPMSDGRARITRPDGRTRIAHRHTCFGCGSVTGWGDDCEGDSDHDFGLCDGCAS